MVGIDLLELGKCEETQTYFKTHVGKTRVVWGNNVWIIIDVFPF